MSGRTPPNRVVEILLVDDSDSDVRLTQEALKDAKVQNNLSRVADGIEAIEYLRHEGKYSKASRPDLILLDLNMPRMDGREVLAEIKADPSLKTIPVAILTTSEAESDVLQSYGLHVNCYLTKPVDFEQFIRVVHQIEEFWFTVVKLPPVRNRRLVAATLGADAVEPARDA
ncbi:MAG: response regulator [Phycisphaerales bacterium]